MKNKKRKLFLTAAALVLLAVLLHGPLLEGAGGFLAPHGETRGDAVVLEGTQVAVTGAVKEALELVREGRVRRLYLVLHRFPDGRGVFAIQEELPGRLGRELERLGLKPGQYRVVSTAVDGHPITLAEARSVVPVLFKDGVRKAVLLAQGFHTRRSWLVYQKLGNSLGIKFTPYPYFPGYSRDKWWRNPEGVKEFVGEGAKWGYYWIWGYI